MDRSYVMPIPDVVIQWLKCEFGERLPGFKSWFFHLLTMQFFVKLLSLCVSQYPHTYDDGDKKSPYFIDL